MRITSGHHKGRQLQTPKNQKVRPTSDKVRQAIFNSLESYGVVRDANVLDAFCGTGALGLEALSRGAKYVVFNDLDRQSVMLCQSNIENLQEQDRAKVVKSNSVSFFEPIGPDQKFTLVFLDPPYKKNLVLPTIENLIEKKLLEKDCFFVIETEKSEQIVISEIKILNEKKYGDTKITYAVLL